jgi:hypothetical protein
MRDTPAPNGRAREDETMTEDHEWSDRDVQTNIEQLRHRLAHATPPSKGGRVESPSTSHASGLGRYFTPDPVKSGVEHYRLRESGYSAWTIIGALRAADGDVLAVAEAYAIPEREIHACIGLLLRHPLPILGRIADEEDSEVVPSGAG